jgi:hypothetical protein
MFSIAFTSLFGHSGFESSGEAAPTGNMNRPGMSGDLLV